MIERSIILPKKQSFFLFGPRQTGKSTYVSSLLTSEDLYINLLPQRSFLSYTKEPDIFRQEILAHHKTHKSFTCIVDEIQKIPALLDEVHDLIESYKIRFILTGSSARKLKRGAANLLAGRAFTLHLYPLTCEELGEKFDLEKALLRGCLPYLWSNDLSAYEEEEFLRSYTDTYLKEEIQAEGTVRNVAPFVRFLDIAANNDGEIVNYSNISRECGVSIKTVQEYYQILEDTFIAYRIDPWLKSVRKRLVSHPRYYMFDMGITNGLCHQFSRLNTSIRGRRFEQFIILQIIALNAYHRLGFQIFFWRTNIGTEVDIILVKGNVPIIALEIKSTGIVNDKDSDALMELKKDYPNVECYIVSQVDRPRLLKNGTLVLNWRNFLSEKLISF